VALLDPDALGLSLTAFVMIEATEHTAEWRAGFLATVEKLDAVCDVYRTAGQYDFLLRVMVADMSAFDRFYENLTAQIKLRSVNSVFAMDRVKTSTELPLANLIGAHT
jgi:Lrp/AsnC family transcriptional regulator